MSTLKINGNDLIKASKVGTPGYKLDKETAQACLRVMKAMRGFYSQGQ